MPARRLGAVLAALALAFGLTAVAGSAASAATSEPALVSGAPTYADDFIEYDGMLYFSAYNGTDDVLYS